MKLLFILTLLFSIQAQAMKLKLRAREHFETHKIDLKTSETTYKGLSNTINVWWEMPFELSFGFYFSPVLASIKEDSANSPLGESIQIFSAGLAAKYFAHKVVPNTYGRVEFGYLELHPEGTRNSAAGSAILLGVGYEFPLEMLGLAFEASYRYADLSRGITMGSFMPAIGFHFYEMF